MSWLVGYTIASMVGALFVVRLCEYVLGGAVGAIAGVAKTSIFVSVWTAITTASGMRSFTRAVGQLRQRNEEVSRLIGTPPEETASIERKRKEKP